MGGCGLITLVTRGWVSLGARKGKYSKPNSVLLQEVLLGLKSVMFQAIFLVNSKTL